MITKDVYNGFMSIWYGERYVETIIKQFQFFFNQDIDKLEHTVLITEWIQNIDAAAYLQLSQKEDVPSRKKKINSIFNRDHWPENFKHGFLWFLFQDIFTFTGNSVEP